MDSTTWIIICIILVVVVAVISSLISVMVRKSTIEKKVGSAEERSREIINEAIKTAEAKKKEALLERRKKILRQKMSLIRKLRNEELKHNAMKSEFLTRKNQLRKRQIHLIRRKTV